MHFIWMYGTTELTKHVDLMGRLGHF